MSLEDRLWTLDKMEAAAVRDYHTKLQNVRDELNTIICENWERIKTENLLTLSILRRLHDFYKVQYQLAETLKVGAIGTSAGEYLEETVHSSLSAFLESQLEKVSVHRALYLKKFWNLKHRADIAVIVNPKYGAKGKLENGTLVFVVECKDYVDMPTFEKARQQYQELSNKGYAYACITTHTNQKMGVRKRDEGLRKEIQEAKKRWLYVMTVPRFGHGLPEYDIKVLTPIEKLYEEILNKCKRQL